MSESQFCIVPVQKGDEERQNCHLAVPVIMPHFPASRARRGASSSLAVPHCWFWGQMLLPFLSY